MSNFAIQAESENLRKIVSTEQLKHAFSKGQEKLVRQYWFGLHPKTTEEWFEHFIVNGEEPINNYQAVHYLFVLTLYYSGLADEIEEAVKKWSELPEERKHQYEAIASDIEDDFRERVTLSDRIWNVVFSCLLFTNISQLENILYESLDFIKFSISQALENDNRILESKNLLEIQIEKNQPALKLLQSWMNEAIDDSERAIRKERFDSLKKIIDDNRPNGKSAFS